MKYPHNISDYKHVSHKKFQKSHKAASKRKYCISIVVQLKDGNSLTVEEEIFRDDFEGALIEHLIMSEMTDPYYEKQGESPFSICIGDYLFYSDYIESVNALLQDVKRKTIIDIDYNNY